MRKLLLLFTASLFGHASHTFYCGKENFCQYVHIAPYGEMLYIKPCAPPFNYAIIDNQVKVLSPNYAVGWRAGIEGTAPGIFASLNTTSIDTSDRITEMGISARLKYHYRAWHLRIGLRVHDCNWMTAWAFAGIPYMRFRETRQLLPSQEEIFFYQAAGPELGLKLSTRCIGGLQLHGLISTRAYLKRQRTVPAINLRWSASFTAPLGGPSITAELGYEILHFFALIGNQDFGFWGPYARINLSF